MSIAEVARIAGTSVATVSRVFNNPEIVNEQLRGRVLDVAKQLGYSPNLSARTLRMRQSKVIGVVLPTLSNPVFSEFVEGVAIEAEARGYSIVMFSSDYLVEKETNATERLIGFGVDAMLLVVANSKTSLAVKKTQEAGIPYVLAYNETPDHPFVSVKNVTAVKHLVKLLHGAGQKKIAMVIGQLGASDRSQMRYEGYLAGMKSCGLQAMPVWELPFTDQGLDQLQDDLRTGDRPTAVICSNDLLAIRTIRAATKVGLRVPQDISVVGFDGIALGADLTPSLASITQPNQDIGRKCVALVCGALVSKTKLSTRDSCHLPYGWRAGESSIPLQVSDFVI